MKSSREGRTPHSTGGKPRPAPPAAALYFGNDAYWVNRRAEERLSSWGLADTTSLQLEIVDGKVETASATVLALRKCCEALQTPSFFGSEKTVWLKQASFLGPSSRAGSGSDVQNWMEKLVGILKKGLPPGVHFLVTADAVDRRTAFFKAMEKLGETESFQVLEKSWEIERQAPEAVRLALQEAGLEAGPGVIESLVAMLGADTGGIRQEVEKLNLYLGSRRRVAVEDVSAIVTSSRGGEAWDLADAAADRHLDRALVVLHRLLMQRLSPIWLIMVLEGRFRELAFYREILSRGWLRAGEGSGSRGGGSPFHALPEEVRSTAAAVLGRDLRDISPFVVSIRARQASRFRPEELAEAREIWLDAHRRLVTTSLNPQWVLEASLIRVLRPKPAHAGPAGEQNRWAIAERRQTV